MVEVEASVVLLDVSDDELVVALVEEEVAVLE